MLKIEVDLKNVLGEIMPVGETHEDTIRIENINNYDLLIRSLLGELYRTATYKESPRYSEYQIGSKAYRFLNYLKQEIDNYLEDLKENEKIEEE